MTTPSPDFRTDNHGWAELLPKRKPCPPLTGEHRYKWAVIGAGLTGLSCARRLAELHPKDEILLLDARQIGQGASGRNAGFAIAVSQFAGKYNPAKKQYYERVNRVNQAGLDLLRESITLHGIDCAWDESGFYYVAADSTAIAERAHFELHLKQMSVPHTSFGAEDLANKLGTKLYKTGTHVPQGALMQPAALVRGLADNLPDNVHLFEQTPVLSIDKGPRPVLNIPGGTVTIDTLILAVNYEAPKLGHLRGRLIGSTLAGSFTRTLTPSEISSLGTLPHWGSLSLHTGGATVRLTRCGRICLRNTAEYRGGRLLPDSVLRARAAIHRSAFEKRFPQLAHVPFEFSWSGVEGLTRNGTNFFGKQAENIYLAGGYNGSGVTRGTAFGASIASYASGVASSLINDCLNGAPASFIPPRPFLDIGAALTVRSRFKGVGLDR